MDITVTRGQTKWGSTLLTVVLNTVDEYGAPLVELYSLYSREVIPTTSGDAGSEILVTDTKTHRIVCRFPNTDIDLAVLTFIDYLYGLEIQQQQAALLRGLIPDLLRAAYNLDNSLDRHSLRVWQQDLASLTAVVDELNKVRDETAKLEPLPYPTVAFA